MCHGLIPAEDSMPATLLSLLLSAVLGDPGITVDVSREFRTVYARAASYHVDVNGESLWIANGSRKRLSVKPSDTGRYKLTVSNFTGNLDPTTPPVVREFSAPPGAEVLVDVAAGREIRSVTVLPPLPSEIVACIPRDWNMTSASVVLGDQTTTLDMAHLHRETLGRTDRNPQGSAVLQWGIPVASLTPNRVQKATLELEGKDRTGSPVSFRRDLIVSGGDCTYVRLGDVQIPSAVQAEMDRSAVRHIEAIVVQALGAMTDHPAENLAFREFCKDFESCADQLKAMDLAHNSPEVEQLRTAYVDYVTVLNDLALHGQSKPAKVGGQIAEGVIGAVLGVLLAPADAGSGASMAAEGLGTLVGVMWVLAEGDADYEGRIRGIQAALKTAQTGCNSFREQLGNRWWFENPQQDGSKAGYLYDFRANGRLVQVSPWGNDGSVSQSSARYWILGQRTLVCWPEGAYEIAALQVHDDTQATYQVIDHSSDESQDGYAFRFKKFLRTHGGFFAVENRTGLTLTYKIRWAVADGKATDFHEYTVNANQRRWHWVNQAFHCDFLYNRTPGQQPTTAVIPVTVDLIENEPASDPRRGRYVSLKLENGEVSATVKTR